jgi:hypothetical protein
MNDINPQMGELVFECQLWRVQRDYEDESKLTLLCDSSQYPVIASIPSRRKLMVAVEVIDE